MAAIMRCLVRFNVGLTNNVLPRNGFLNSCRSLFSDSRLGLHNYENTRLNFRNQFLNVETTFRKKMDEVCETDSSLIFTEDLKSMLHLVQKKPEDVELLIKMLNKFNSQNKEMRFGAFVFGPVVMRTFYYLDEPDLAFTFFKDPKFENFFDQLSSFQILLDLLYKHGKYAEMREAYDMIKKKEFIHTYPRNSFILVIAACYKENTSETLKYALDLWKELNENKMLIVRRASSFLAALAIKQNMPHIAMEILSSLRDSRYIQLRNLKVLAYTQSSRFIDIVPIFRTSLETDMPNGQKEVYFEDVIKKLEEAMTKENIPEEFELYKLLALLKKNDQIIFETFDNNLCAKIKDTRNLNNMPMQSFSQQQSFRRNNSGPVLRDLL